MISFNKKGERAGGDRRECGDRRQMMYQISFADRRQKIRRSGVERRGLSKLTF